MVKFPGGKVTAYQVKERRRGDSVVIVLGRCKTPGFGLEICNLGTSWGVEIFLKELRTFLGVHKECKPGFSFLCQQFYKFKLFAKDEGYFLFNSERNGTFRGYVQPLK